MVADHLENRLASDPRPSSGVHEEKETVTKQDAETGVIDVNRQPEEGTELPAGRCGLLDERGTSGPREDSGDFGLITAHCW